VAYYVEGYVHYTLYCLLTLLLEYCKSKQYAIILSVKTNTKQAKKSRKRMYRNVVNKQDGFVVFAVCIGIGSI